MILAFQEQRLGRNMESFGVVDWPGHTHLIEFHMETGPVGKEGEA